ncbi:hypothetical protein, unlikely [Trypanosoma brucei gambiense DAL972]|uniref:Uncharacterized protein n=2 Tax=Trypanosoma brucei TaxID=5691 RepID=C9ZI18_TRYB9|nr:hypothetical protein, unlikely [Trypanosoma brucei gambiense DAL972]RHW74312.1 hypothetical protein DPX39_010043700 [Trypanosoma brucei equiperdum]CBH09135.1 hypothetical protein, unlikely [Trypanosoma brucei gambiense DAL972]|eukprot:XP_011771576.1 hypothetical protein, unlikely [Trypanosoma brucei gambiense DAL972]
MLVLVLALRVYLFGHMHAPNAKLFFVAVDFFYFVAFPVCSVAYGGEELCTCSDSLTLALSVVLVRQEQVL